MLLSKTIRVNYNLTLPSWRNFQQQNEEIVHIEVLSGSLQTHRTSAQQLKQPITTCQSVMSCLGLTTRQLDDVLSGPLK